MDENGFSKTVVGFFEKHLHTIAINAIYMFEFPWREKSEERELPLLELHVYTNRLSSGGFLDEWSSSWTRSN